MINHLAHKGSPFYQNEAAFHNKLHKKQHFHFEDNHCYCLLEGLSGLYKAVVGPGDPDIIDINCIQKIILNGLIYVATLM